MNKLKLTLALLAGFALASFTTAAFAADNKETTVTGTALCAKCALHTSDKCETVLKATVDGKEVLYTLTGKEAKDFHKNICSKADGEKVTVTGKVTEKDGKSSLRATKIEEVKS
jgi:tRNA(Leu) C34 or U34 (ribose-2'-O)-methylase TrmL